MLNDLEKIAETDLSINIHRKPWPQASNVLWYRLQEVRPNLLAENISVERDRTGSHRSIRLQRVVGKSSQLSSPSGETPDGDEKGDNDSSDDGCDGDDGSADKPRGEPKVLSMTPQETPEEKAARAAVEIMFNIPYENVQCSENKETSNNDEEIVTGVTNVTDDTPDDDNDDSPAISEGESEPPF